MGPSQCPDSFICGQETPVASPISSAEIDLIRIHNDTLKGGDVTAILASPLDPDVLHTVHDFIYKTI
jgi:hypothetical protein